MGKALMVKITQSLKTAEGWVAITVLTERHKEANAR